MAMSFALLRLPYKEVLTEIRHRLSEQFNGTTKP